MCWVCCVQLHKCLVWYSPPVAGFSLRSTSFCVSVRNSGGGDSSGGAGTISPSTMGQVVLLLLTVLNWPLHTIYALLKPLLQLSSAAFTMQATMWWNLKLRNALSLEWKSIFYCLWIEHRCRSWDFHDGSPSLLMDWNLPNYSCNAWPFFVTGK